MKSNSIVKCYFDELPKMLLINLASFFDFKSLINFSTTQKKYYGLFSDFTKIYSFFKKCGFKDEIEKLKNDELISYNFYFTNIVMKKDISKMIDNYKGTPLHCACVRSFSPKIIKILLKYKCNVNQKECNDNYSALHLSCERSGISLKTIKCLVEYKGDLNLKSKYNNCTPFHLACEKKSVSLKIINLLVDKKGDLNSKCFARMTPLHYACDNENVSPKIIKFLIESKSDSNLEGGGMLPIHYVSRNQNISLDLIKFLLKNKTNLNLKCSERNKTAIDYALENKNISLEILKFFDELKVLQRDLNHLLLDICEGKMSLGTIKFLVEKKCDLNYQDMLDTSPLHNACKNSRITLEIIKYFFENKSDFNLKNTSNLTPLELLSRNPYVTPEIQDYLRKKLEIDEFSNFENYYYHNYNFKN